MSNTTLSQYLQQQTGKIPTELAEVINAIATCCNIIDYNLQQGAIAGILGSAEHENVQGETQKNLDIFSNEQFINALQKHPHVGGFASEELEEFLPAQENGEYLVLFDPLDGSSNIDINMCVGSIFSVLPAKNKITQAEDFMQPGTSQVAAGYVMYGPSTMLALTFGTGVILFTYDIDLKDFVLTQENVTIPHTTQEFAINSSNHRHWEKPVQRYISELLDGKTGVRGKDFNMRWIACMVGDIHRILSRGGIFMYPFDLKNTGKPGRLRLMYEANPMSMLIEQAGGDSTTGRERIMDIQPTGLHQRVPVILGAKDEIELLKSYH
ncbi:class 1 fructose-bisphosphatase [Acinetobacter rathckeae]|uniref:class 1 fructose-bisphosphatase n=1 Tax=Acinetobacter rathckeae TaxID=2605272 RepID=UPI0018A2BC93|nr:class 1 fructose-bisphosphatase [Acinetobacter rathckeae]MBF7694916.1 class 1 fructose-bisphosphatase [Acinetobacter rathckeae]